MSADVSDRRRALPSVDQALLDPGLRDALRAHGRLSVLRELRLVLREARARAAAQDAVGFAALVDDLAATISSRLDRKATPSLLPVINATGVVIHTNLGRSPLPRSVASRVAEIAGSYSNLELDLATGERGDREAHAEWRLREILDVEATAVVNNCAAAVLLAVNTLAEGREVLVSRGELVEIGGSFRIPDVLRKGGARLREVGTTNRTRIADYEEALSPDTGMILKVHPSNFRIVGFTEAPTRRELALLARSAGLPLVEDQGNGLLEAPWGALAGEETVRQALQEGVDVVTFSGDKLLGGPQAGLLAGREQPVTAMRTNPLYRALRVDKMTLAALDAVLVEHASGRGAESLPVLRMLAATPEALRARAEGLAREVREGAERRGARAEVGLAESSSAVGGGAAPTRELPTVVVVLGVPGLGAARIAERLRLGEPPVIARIADDRVLVDLRTVSPDEEAGLREALVRALTEPD